MHTVIEDAEGNKTTKYEQSVDKHNCNVCGKYFAKPHNLKMHKYQMHTSPEDLLFPCDVCEQRFR